MVNFSVFFLLKIFLYFLLQKIVFSRHLALFHGKLDELLQNAELIDEKRSSSTWRTPRKVWILILTVFKETLLKICFLRVLLERVAQYAS